jgi:hypothetical protein
MLADCEQRPMMTAAMPRDCKMMFQECMKKECGEGEPCPKQEFTCENKCADRYFYCVSIGGIDCAPEVAKCLDSCKPVEQMPCDRRCAVIEKECLGAGVDEESCAMKAKECIARCYPQPAEPEQTGCREICARRHKECVGSDVDASKCDEDLKSCARLCESSPVADQQRDAEVPQESPRRGFWARIASWFGG